MYTPGGPHGVMIPGKQDFEIAIVSSITSTIVFNKLFVIFATKKEDKKNE